MLCIFKQNENTGTWIYIYIYIYTYIYIYIIFVCVLYIYRGFSCDSVKNLPAVQETQIQSLGQEDSLEKGMATHSNILAWRIPWTEEPGRL